MNKNSSQRCTIHTVSLDINILQPGTVHLRIGCTLKGVGRTWSGRIRCSCQDSIRFAIPVATCINSIRVSPMLMVSWKRILSRVTALAVSLRVCFQLAQCLRTGSYARYIVLTVAGNVSRNVSADLWLVSRCAAKEDWSPATFHHLVVCVWAREGLHREQRKGEIQL